VSKDKYYLAIIGFIAGIIIEIAGVSMFVYGFLFQEWLIAITGVLLGIEMTLTDIKNKLDKRTKED